jgi:hypothetical protein
MLLVTNQQHKWANKYTLMNGDLTFYSYFNSPAATRSVTPASAVR